VASRLILPAFSVYIKVEIDFGSNWNVALASASFTDVTADLRFQDGISWDRGKNAAWDQLAPGSFSFTLDNRAGTYEPATATDVVGTRLCRITAYYPNPTSTSYVQMVGVIDQFDVQYPAYGKDQVVNVSGVDWLTSLWLSKIISVGAPLATSTGWYQAICNAAGIPASYQSFTAGTFTLKPATITKTDCLTALGNIANSQVHFLYVSKTGVITAIALASGSNTQTYDDASATYPFTNLKGGVGGTGTYTIVEVSQPGSITVSTGDNPPVTANIAGTPLPKTKFGPQVLQINAAPVTNPSGLVASWAGAVPTPATYWWRELEIKPMKAPATLAPAVLGAELGDRISVVSHPLQGGTISKAASIRSIKHEIRGGDWTVTFGLTNR
jgi:hypothetical protein